MRDLLHYLLCFSDRNKFRWRTNNILKEAKVLCKQSRLVATILIYNYYYKLWDLTIYFNKCLLTLTYNIYCSQCTTIKNIFNVLMHFYDISIHNYYYYTILLAIILIRTILFLVIKSHRYIPTKLSWKLNESHYMRFTYKV